MKQGPDRHDLRGEAAQKRKEWRAQDRGEAMRIVFVTRGVDPKLGQDWELGVDGCPEAAAVRRDQWAQRGYTNIRTEQQERKATTIGFVPAS